MDDLFLTHRAFKKFHMKKILEGSGRSVDIYMATTHDDTIEKIEEYIRVDFSKDMNVEEWYYGKHKKTKNEQKFSKSAVPFAIFNIFSTK